MSAASFTAPFLGSNYTGLKSNCSKLVPDKDSITWRQKTISNGSRTQCMKTWNPIDNKKFETLSYLPPLSEESLAKEIEYMLKQGWIPCLEFDETGSGIVFLQCHFSDLMGLEKSKPISNTCSMLFQQVGFVYRENSTMPGYYDGRYWTLWKLPMFGCNSSSQVLNEIQECKKAYPNAYIRCLAFNNVKQVQCMAFIVQKPSTATTAH